MTISNHTEDSGQLFYETKQAILKIAYSIVKRKRCFTSKKFDWKNIRTEWPNCLNIAVLKLIFWQFFFNDVLYSNLDMFQKFFKA